MPLSAAILLLIGLIYLAIVGDTPQYQIDETAIWMTILINSGFIAYGLYKRYTSRQDMKRSLEIRKEMMDDSFSEACTKLKNHESEEHVSSAMQQLISNSKKGHIPSTLLLKRLYEMNKNSNDAQ